MDSDAFDQFTLISTETRENYDDTAFGDFTKLSGASQKSTDVSVANSLRKRHPDLILTINNPLQCNLLGFASAGHAQCKVDPDNSLTIQSYVPPPNRLEGESGTVAERVVFGKYLYVWEEHEYVVYIVEGFKDGSGLRSLNFILCKPAGNETVGSKSSLADSLTIAASNWSLQLHEEIYVFDQLFWQKDKNLWQGVQGASWDDVILDEDQKTAVRNDIEGFYDDKDVYKEFGIPWKRGIIFYGPPGTGKTISIKAIMRTLTQLPNPIPILYVKSFTPYNPEYGIRSCFALARSMAPCLLIFEDVDSLVTPSTRSYFLNEVDGLEKNDGILMLASTNHRMYFLVTYTVELLDPGISKRPSRFDRKYFYGLPSQAERVQYCEYWRGKLKSNPKIEFPKRLSKAIADITAAFSFAYLKEAFIAALLTLVVNRNAVARSRTWIAEDGNDHGDDDLDNYPLWIAIKKQIKILRDELGSENKSFQNKSISQQAFTHRPAVPSMQHLLDEIRARGAGDRY